MSVTKIRSKLHQNQVIEVPHTVAENMIRSGHAELYKPDEEKSRAEAPANKALKSAPSNKAEKKSKSRKR